MEMKVRKHKFVEVVREIMTRMERINQMWLAQSTSSTDRLLTSTASGLSQNTSVAPLVLHSLPPSSNRTRRPYQATTAPKTVAQSTKYDKVPTQEISSYASYESYESFDKKIREDYNSFSNLIKVFEKEKMASDVQSQFRQNMTQCFNPEGPIKSKDVKEVKDVSIDNTTVQVPEEQQQGKSSLAPQVLAAVSLSLGSLVVGFVSAYTSPASVSMRALQSDNFLVSEQEVSWIGGVMPLAALVGGMVGGPFIDHLGRKRTILATALPFVISSLLIAFAFDVPTVLVGRTIAGICVGILSLSLPVYLGETLQPEVRGVLGLLPTALGNTGILLCFVAGKYLDWKELALLGAVIPVPFLILMFVVPETPTWEFSKGRAEKAKSSLQWLRGKSADIGAEFKEIERNIVEKQKTGSGSTLKDLVSPSVVKPIMILIGLMFFQQMSGINAVIFYTVTIFKDAGSTIDENLCTIIVGVVNFCSTFLATALIDRAGRKILLYISAFSMVGTLMTLGTFFYFQNNDVDMSQYGWLPLASFIVYVVGFSLGFGPIPWLMMGEILPANVRGSAASVTTAFNWTCTFIVTKTFADIIAGLGNHGAFWMFGSITFVGIFFIYFFVPETRGKSLEDIEKKFAQPRRRISSLGNLKPTPLAV